MPRRTLIRSATHPYHVVNQVNNREWFHLPKTEVWEILNHKCLNITQSCGAQIHALVMMSNHYHMILSCPQSDLGEVMWEFGRSVVRTYNNSSGRKGHLFIGRYKWSLVCTANYYSCALKYVFRNPVRAGICENVEDYPFSSLLDVSQCGLGFPIASPSERLLRDLPKDPQTFLRWLNTPFQSEDSERIRKGLRRRIFKLPRDYNGRSTPIDAA